MNTQVKNLKQYEWHDSSTRYFEPHRLGSHLYERSTRVRTPLSQLIHISTTHSPLRRYHGLVPTDHTSPLFVQIPSQDVFALTTIPFQLTGLTHLLIKDIDRVECKGNLEATLLVQNRLRRRRALRMDEIKGRGG